MRRIFNRMVMLAVVAAAPATAMAGELGPLHAHSTDLGGVSVVAYYTEEPNGYRVVVTAAPEAEGGMPIRFAATLLPDQRSVIMVPQRVNELPLGLEIARFGDRVVVEKTENGLLN